MHPVDKILKPFISGTDRVILTASQPFDAKNRKKVSALADIRNRGNIDTLFTLLDVVQEKKAMNWFCITDYHLNFMKGKQLLGYVGIIEWEILRLPDNSDYDLRRGTLIQLF